MTDLPMDNHCTQWKTIDVSSSPRVQIGNPKLHVLFHFWLDTWPSCFPFPYTHWPDTGYTPNVWLFYGTEQNLPSFVCKNAYQSSLFLPSRAVPFISSTPTNPHRLTPTSPTAPNTVGPSHSSTPTTPHYPPIEEQTATCRQEALNPKKVWLTRRNQLTAQDLAKILAFIITFNEMKKVDQTNYVFCGIPIYPSFSPTAGRFVWWWDNLVWQWVSMPTGHWPRAI